MLAPPPAPSIPWHGMLEEGYPKGAPQHPVRLGESRWWDSCSGDLHEGKPFRNKDAVKIFPTTFLTSSIPSERDASIASIPFGRPASEHPPLKAGLIRNTMKHTRFVASASDPGDPGSTGYSVAIVRDPTTHPHARVGG